MVSTDLVLSHMADKTIDISFSTVFKLSLFFVMMLVKAENLSKSINSLIIHAYIEDMWCIQ